MADEENFIKGAVGQVLRVRMLSEESTETIADGDNFFVDIERPDDTEVRRVAALDTSTNKHITYTFIADDTAQDGTHRAHGIFEKGGDEIPGKQTIFHVLNKFEGKGEAGAADSLVVGPAT